MGTYTELRAICKCIGTPSDAQFAACIKLARCEMDTPEFRRAPSQVKRTNG